MDFISNQGCTDERPYLEINILNQTFLGLLDSGSTKTILGSKGWSVISSMGVTLNKGEGFCTVANGQRCALIGSCTLPIRFKDKVVIVEVQVIPELPHVLILGWDFWKLIGLVPVLKDWHFLNSLSAVNAVEFLQGESVLSTDQKTLMDSMLNRNFELMGKSLGCSNRAEHVIKSDSAPIKQRYYRVSPVMQQYIDAELDEMLKLGVIESSNSPWSSPIVMVKKKDLSYRFCVDFRKLNSVTERDSYPIPMVADTLDKLRNAQFCSTLDIKSAYWQVPMAESSRPFTAFTVPNRGLFQFIRMPFGLHNAPATWQRLIDGVLGHDLEPHVFVYLDDVVIVTRTFEQHLQVLEEVFRRLRDANLTVSITKCQFCRPQLKYLGYVIDKYGLHVDPSKVQAMLEIPSPTNVGDVRRFVGTCSWYRRFIPNFSTILAPITALLRKSTKFCWTDECDESFRSVKELLVSAPVLSCPDYSLPFQIQCDASGFGIGAVLSQPQTEGGEKVISYLSRSLSRAERNYSTTERECLAVLWAVEKLRPYIEGISFTVVTDHHSLVWLQKLQDPIGRLARWSIRLQQFDFKIIHRKGSEHVVPDLLSRSVPMIDVLDIQGPIKDKWYLRMVSKVQKDPLKYRAWRVDNNQLFKYVQSEFPDLSHPSDSWKVVVPKEDRSKVVIAAHDPPTMGHMGVYKTYGRLCDKYYWPKMRNDVGKYVKKCRICLAHKPSTSKPVDMMVSHPKPGRPWEVISMDLMGPLPRSKRGNCYILVVTDYLSKFSLVFALRRSTADLIVRRVEDDVFLLFGVPRVVICDNGPQFKSKQFKHLCDSYECKIKFTPHYNPRSNPTERVNRTIKTMISMYVSDNHKVWDENLSKISCAIRSAKHETTTLSPFFVNFGRRMMLSGSDYEKNLSEVTPGTTLDDVSKNKAFNEIFKGVRKRLEAAGEYSANRYNLRRRYLEFLPNQLVWRKNYVLSDASKYFASKLAPKYIGPFLITRRISPWSYELRDNDGNNKGVWNIKDLRANPTDEDECDVNCLVEQTDPFSPSLPFSQFCPFSVR